MSRSKIIIKFQFDENIFRFCSLQPVITFTKKDSIEIKLPIISRDGEINHFGYNWSDLKFIEVSSKNFTHYEKKTPKKIEMQFDPQRYCEIDRTIGYWKSENKLSRKNSINELRVLFGSLFAIECIIYDVSKYYIFKVKAKASKIGKLLKNKYVRFDLEIVEESEGVNNQIQCLGLMNYSDRVFQIRKNSIVFFYVTELNSLRF